MFRTWRRLAAAVAVIALLPVAGSAAPRPAGTRDVIVHLFQWPWASVARECTEVLGPRGFGGVQVSPPQEHVVLPARGYPWWQDYQPVSYQLVSRRGDREAFAAVLYAPGEPIRPEYAGTGALIEARYGPRLSQILRSSALSLLEDLGRPTGIAITTYAPSDQAVVYVDSHDSQRDGSTLTYQDGPLYALAQAFLLTWPYGTPLVMSSFAFSAFDAGPPANASGRTLPARCAPDAYVCEHRALAGLVGFRRAVAATPVRGWWATRDQLGFARGHRGYVVINRATTAFSRVVETGLPPGVYRDVVNGDRVTVDRAGRATVTVAGLSALAINR